MVIKCCSDGQLSRTSFTPQKSAERFAYGDLFIQTRFTNELVYAEKHGLESGNRRLSIERACGMTAHSMQSAQRGKRGAPA